MKIVFPHQFSELDQVVWFRVFFLTATASLNRWAFVYQLIGVAHSPGLGSWGKLHASLRLGLGAIVKAVACWAMFKVHTNINYMDIRVSVPTAWTTNQPARVDLSIIHCWCGIRTCGQGRENIYIKNIDIIKKECRIYWPCHLARQ